MGKLEEKQQEKRKNIVKAATNLFAFSGYSDTTISKITKEAGISFGSVFTYFETKESLFEAVIIEPIENMKKILFEMPKEPLNHNKFKEMTKQHIDFFTGQRPYLQLIQQVLGQPDKFPTLFERLNQFYQEWLEELIQVIQSGQSLGLLEKMDPMAVGEGYISFLVGIRLTVTDEPTNHVWSRFYVIANRILGIKGEGG